MRTMIVLRGLPGSGKSTLAQSYVDPDTVVFSSDDYFVRDGVYSFHQSMISQAHEWNRTRVEDEVCNGRQRVVVDNTNVSLYEMKPYLLIALKFGLRFVVVEPSNRWSHNCIECAQRTTHGVPVETIMSMQRRWQAYDDSLSHRGLLSILDSFAPWESPGSFALVPRSLSSLSQEIIGLELAQVGMLRQIGETDQAGIDNLAAVAELVDGLLAVSLSKHRLVESRYRLADMR